MNYTNRYGDEYTFSLNENGNIQWSGNFEHSRFGAANVYNDAYNEFKKDGGTLSIEEFIKEVHHYDEETYKPSKIAKTYGNYVYSDWDTITMVDPSGGPYISKGMDMKYYGFDGKIVASFTPNNDGYEIVVENESNIRV